MLSQCMLSVENSFHRDFVCHRIMKCSGEDIRSFHAGFFMLQEIKIQNTYIITPPLFYCFH